MFCRTLYYKNYKCAAEIIDRITAKVRILIVETFDSLVFFFTSPYVTIRCSFDNLLFSQKSRVLQLSTFQFHEIKSLPHPSKGAIPSDRSTEYGGWYCTAMQNSLHTTQRREKPRKSRETQLQLTSTLSDAYLVRLDHEKC